MLHTQAYDGRSFTHTQRFLLLTNADAPPHTQRLSFYRVYRIHPRYSRVFPGSSPAGSLASVPLARACPARSHVPRSLARVPLPRVCPARSCVSRSLVTRESTVVRVSRSRSHMSRSLAHVPPLARARPARCIPKLRAGVEPTKAHRGRSRMPSK